VKGLLKHYAERIDAATLRQRLVVFLSAAAVLLLFGNALFIHPQRVKQQRLAAETAQYQHELGVLQAEMGRLVGAAGGDPEAASRKREAALRAELSTLNGRLSSEERRFTPPERMRSVLQEMLVRNRRLTLLGLRTLPAVPITPSHAPGANATMFRHSIEVTVQGTYADLYDYLRRLEELPSQLYWSRADVAVTEHPILTLKLTVHTISFDRAWLVV